MGAERDQVAGFGRLEDGPWWWDADAPKPVLAGAGGSAMTAGHLRPASA